MPFILPISSAFAHTRCISPSVCLLKSFMQASTSLLRGRRGRSRAAHRNQRLRLFALALADGSGLPFSLYPPPAALESQTPQREARALPRRAQSFQRRVPQLSPPKRAALIRHCAAQRRTVPPSPRGRLRAPPQSAELSRGAEICAPSHSVSTEKGSTLSVLPFLRFIYRAPTL